MGGGADFLRVLFYAGKVWFANGDRYEGEYKDNKRNGQGKPHTHHSIKSFSLYPKLMVCLS